MVPGEKSMPEARSRPSPHQQAIVTAMPGGLPVPKNPNIQQIPAHGMKCSGVLGGGERVSLPCHPLAYYTWQLERKGELLQAKRGNEEAE